MGLMLLNYQRKLLMPVFFITTEIEKGFLKKQDSVRAKLKNNKS
jgi:hypothetical protein